MTLNERLAAVYAVQGELFCYKNTYYVTHNTYV